MLYDERPHNQNEIIIMINRNSLIFDFEELAVQCIKEIWPTCKIEVDGVKISCRKHILWKNEKKDILSPKPPPHLKKNHEKIGVFGDYNIL